MKRIYLILTLLIVFSGASVALAQNDSDGDGLPDTRDQCPTQAGTLENSGCPVLQIAPNPQPVDTDGDGLPDSDDQCPTVAGPRENRGCPVLDLAPNPQQPVDTDGDGLPDSEDQCPTVAGIRENNGCPGASATPNPIQDLAPNPNIITNTPPPAPPFTPPALPADACFVTPNVDNNVNVREEPRITANVVGFLAPGVIYAADGYVMDGPNIWFVLNNYEGGSGNVGYASRAVLTASACTEIAFSDASGVDGVIINEEATPRDGTETVEYCVYIEAQEAGVYEEVCYEVEIPEGCWLTTAEAGVYTVQCRPDIGDATNLVFETLPSDDTLPNRGGTQTVEYCIYIEAQEAGVYEEVCYEVEIPEGCWLTTAEAGVFTVQCRPEIGGEVGYAVETLPSDDTLPNRGGTQTVEYCIYIEAQEAGVYEEVCYEVEIPEGCWLTTAEAGVFTVQCRPEIGGEVGFVAVVNINENAERDCNNNGIDDLDEFFPPDCYGQLTSNATNDSNTLPTGNLPMDYIITGMGMCEPGQIWLIQTRTGQEGRCVDAPAIEVPARPNN